MQNFIWDFLPEKKYGILVGGIKTINRLRRSKIEKVGIDLP